MLGKETIRHGGPERHSARTYDNEYADEKLNAKRRYLKASDQKEEL
jgi:hypothetical protein